MYLHQKIKYNVYCVYIVLQNTFTAIEVGYG